MSGIKRYSVLWQKEETEESLGEYVKFDDHAAEIARLRAEADALRVDAERYRWLRSHGAPDLGPHVICYTEDFGCGDRFVDKEELDSLIDEAMGADA